MMYIFHTFLLYSIVAQRNPCDMLKFGAVQFRGDVLLSCFCEYICFNAIWFKGSCYIDVATFIVRVAAQQVDLGLFCLVVTWGLFVLS